MGKFVLTGVDGQLGGQAAEYVLESAKPTDNLVFTTRGIDRIPAEKLKRWKDQGVVVLAADYDSVPSMEAAFKDADAVTLISTWMIGNIRRAQHRRAINAAKAAGVKRICYTSYIGAGEEKNTPLVASDHRDTEQAIYESGLDWSIQRNNFYLDNFFHVLFPTAAKFCDNKLLSNTSGTPTGYVAKADCARVMAALLLGKGRPNVVYDVTGSRLVSDREILAMVRDYTGWDGKEVEMTDDELYEYWESRGVPRTVEGDYSKSPLPICTDDLVQNNVAIRTGIMAVVSDSVERLTGHKPLSPKDVMLQWEDNLKLLRP
ncbi:MAG: hypothetical protein M1819_007359 [Sarea resinae]|nr:MAG: hypothetical protein M1819_007359 [Sarea resinae]